MEFQFRAGDERTGPPPSTDVAATSAVSKFAGDIQHAEIVPPPASHPEKPWRQAAKALIRERILREEGEELLELEAQVRREIMEEGIPLLRSGLGRSEGACAALGSLPMPAPSGTQTPIELEARSRANALPPLVAFPVKRKNTDIAGTSTASISTDSNKQKLDLRCTVCDIPATSEKALQDHLKGKLHMKKAAKLAQPTTEAGHEDEAMQDLEANALAVLPDKQINPNIVTGTSKTHKPALTCKVCGITSTSLKAMQDHLEGKTHKKKVSKITQTMPEEEVPSKAKVPRDASILPAAAASDKKRKLDLTCTGKAQRKKVAEDAAQHGHEEKEEEGSFTPRELQMITNDGASHDVMQMNGSVLCRVCNVSTADVITMMCHLQGTKHTSKARREAARKPPAPAPAMVTIAAASAPVVTIAAVSVVVDGDAAETVAMNINGVPHTVRRVGSSLLCELCDVKVASASEGVMRSHLSGRMHTNKLKAVVAVDMGAAVGKAETITKDLGFATNDVHTTETPGQEVTKDDGADSTTGGSELVHAKSKEASHVAGMASRTQCNGCMEKPVVGGACLPESMAPDEPTTVECPTATVVLEKKAYSSRENCSRMQETEAVKTDDGIAVVPLPADEEVVKYKVEGKEFLLLRQPDGKLSCRLCGVRDCDKYDMIKHLYTHFGNSPVLPM